MKISKFGHCCLLVEDKDVRVLIDPGIYSEIPKKLERLDALLITHIHPDHLDMDALPKILRASPKVRVITNVEVGRTLEKYGINFEGIKNGEKVTIKKGFDIEACGTSHAIIHESLSPMQNTGFFIGDRLFYPGDAFTVPEREVLILALPVAGSWLKLSEAVAYAQKIHPQICFPVHDGILKKPGLVHTVPQNYLPKKGIDFFVIEGTKEI